jgi:hypothetical protein
MKKQVSENKRPNQYQKETIGCSVPIPASQIFTHEIFDKNVTEIEAKAVVSQLF